MALSVALPFALRLRLSLRLGLSVVLALSVAALSWYKLKGGLSQNDSLRLEIWSYAWQHSSLLGRGVGQYFSTAGQPFFHPAWGSQHTHNDWLEIYYDLGIGGTALAAIFAMEVLYWPDTDSDYRWVWLAFMVLCFFSFSLHNPATAILGLLAAGRVYGSRYMVHRWRSEHPDQDSLGLPPLSDGIRNPVAVRPIHPKSPHRRQRNATHSPGTASSSLRAVAALLSSTGWSCRDALLVGRFLPRLSLASGPSPAPRVGLVAGDSFGQVCPGSSALRSGPAPMLRCGTWRGGHQ